MVKTTEKIKPGGGFGVVNPTDDSDSVRVIAESHGDELQPVGGVNGIGIGGSNNLAEALIESGLAGSDYGTPGFGNHFDGVFFGDPGSMVGGGVVDNDNFIIGGGKILPGEGGETGIQVVFLVVGTITEIRGRVMLIFWSLCI